MKVISTNQELAELCKKANNKPYIALDTEFVSEKTYFPKLCLIQVALPECDESDGSEFIIDTLNPKLKLDNLIPIFQNQKITKVLHSAKQDLEIFHHEFGLIPEPLFDTQIAAMLCGYGSQISYSNLVSEICKVKLDKSQQYSNWSTRPLTGKQMEYAISDVTYLRDIYLAMNEKLLETGRLGWVEELFDELKSTCKNSYNPADAWKKIKMRDVSGKRWSIVHALAEFREIRAQSKNINRRWVLSDQALLELASMKPRTIEDLKRCRFFKAGKDAQKRFNLSLLEVISKAQSNPRQPPHTVGTNKPVNKNKEVTDLLKVYLKYSSEQSGVAEEIISTADELREISQGNINVRPLHGWRRELFGNNALKLCQGKIALTLENSKLTVIELENQ